MRCRWGGVVIALFLGGIAATCDAAAEDAVRIARPLDLATLPLLVMEHDKLIEKAAAARGINAPTVTWSVPGKTGPLEAVATGESDLAVADLAGFLLAADAAGASSAVRGLAALVQRPYVLVSRNPAIRTIRDFSNSDRIAVPALKTSGPALLLEMAATAEWGAARYDRLDPLLVARPDAAATDALLAGKPEITAHFSRTPYADSELGEPALHRVMDSFDIAGPHSTTILMTTTRFRDANPALCAAILAALDEADRLIADNPGAAAEIFAAMAPDEDIPVEDLADMIGDPDAAYTAAPAGIMRLAEFMHRTGRLKRRPQAWSDLFVSEARELPGN